MLVLNPESNKLQPHFILCIKLKGFTGWLHLLFVLFLGALFSKFHLVQIDLLPLAAETGVNGIGVSSFSRACLNHRVWTGPSATLQPRLGKAFPQLSQHSPCALKGSCPCKCPQSHCMPTSLAADCIPKGAYCLPISFSLAKPVNFSATQWAESHLLQ